MGYGTITGGGADGRYTIYLDYGEATKTAYLSALNENLVRLDIELSAAQIRLNEANSKVDEALLALSDQTTDYIATAGSGGASFLATQAALAALEYDRKLVIEAQKLSIDARLKVEAIKLARAQTLDYIVRWNAAVLTQTKSAWCTDYTESGAGTVATIDIESESGLTLIAPGCRGWTPADGYMRATDVMSPEQAYWNLAAHPAAQKWKPTYRWGTLTGINYENDTADVSLASATSDAADLNINQSSTLTAVPIEYMTCNASIFNVDDRVLVQFQDQDWTAPKVIGFLDNPKPCGFECIYLTFGGYIFAPLLASQVLAIFTGSATVEAKINGADWVALTLNPIFTTATSKRWEYSYSMPGRPVDNPATAIITFRVDTDGVSTGLLSGLPAHVAADCSPHWPPGEDRVRVVVELRVKLGAALAFNAAIADTGWSGESIYQTGLCKVAGGIDLVTLPSNGPSNPVGPLTYTLTGLG